MAGGWLYSDSLLWGKDRRICPRYFPEILIAEMPKYRVLVEIFLLASFFFLVNLI